MICPGKDDLTKGRSSDTAIWGEIYYSPRPVDGVGWMKGIHRKWGQSRELLDSFEQRLIEYNIFSVTLAVVLKMEAWKTGQKNYILNLCSLNQWLIFKAPNLVQNIHKKGVQFWLDGSVGWNILLYTKRLQVPFLVTANSQAVGQSPGGGMVVTTRWCFPPQCFSLSFLCSPPLLLSLSFFHSVSKINKCIFG